MKKLLSLLLAALLLSLALTSCGLTVPAPAVKEGEFNFTVTYEINGATQTVSGVYACKYNGTHWALDGGTHRDWIGYIKGGEVEEMIEIGTAADGSKIELNLAFYPEYFMGDPLTGGKEIPAPWISVRVEDSEGLYFENNADYIAETYGARIVSYEYAAPIENSFALFN